LIVCLRVAARVGVGGGALGGRHGGLVLRRSCVRGVACRRRPPLSTRAAAALRKSLTVIYNVIGSTAEDSFHLGSKVRF
jgi:hypothetical protein